MTKNSDVRNDFLNALLEVDTLEAFRISENIYKDKEEILDIESLVVDVLEEIGNGWETGKYALAQVYMSSSICEEILMNYIKQENIPYKESPKIGIACFIDSHSLGKNMVILMLRTSGYEVLDIGTGLETKEIIDKVIENNIEILFLSTLMFNSALKIKLFKEKLDLLGRNVKLIVGGAPFRLDSDLWKSVGADADGKNSTDVVKVLQQVMEVNND